MTDSWHRCSCANPDPVQIGLARVCRTCGGGAYPPPDPDPQSDASKETDPSYDLLKADMEASKASYELLTAELERCDMQTKALDALRCEALPARDYGQPLADFEAYFPAAAAMMLEETHRRMDLKPWETEQSVIALEQLRYKRSGHEWLSSIMLRFRIERRCPVDLCRLTAVCAASDLIAERIGMIEGRYVQAFNDHVVW